MSAPDQGKILVITGASRGIGAHLAERATEAGYRVIGLARTAETSRAYSLRACDITNPDAVTAALADVLRAPSLYGLINAAGIASMNLTISTPPDTVRRVVDTNLSGSIFCAQKIGKALARRGEGRIITFSSIAVPLAIKGEAVYAASKAGVEAFTRSFAREMGDFGVTVNAVAPGPVDTDLIAKVPEARIKEIIERQIITRKASLDDIWDVVSLILDQRADLLTGQVFAVGGA